jgi:two-component system, OmpR family, alkaline phosphatase synthesis response regulator PhoP
MDYLIYSVEDDKDIAHIINLTLSKAGYQIEVFNNGKDFLNALKKKKPNMVLLDMMLPDIPGQELIKKIRDNSQYDDMDVIIISANRMIIDKIDGLDLGADDYIEKPFDILELMSRINARVRRVRKSSKLEVGGIKLDLDKHICYKNGKQINLTPREFDILSLILSKKGAIVKREEVLTKIWGTDVSLETRTIDMHINSIRKKIADTNASVIVTLYGVGFKVNV